MGEQLGKWSPEPLGSPTSEHLLYVGEVASLLDISGFVSYRQMHRMWTLSRHCQGVLPWPERGWEWVPYSQALIKGAVEVHKGSQGHRVAWSTYNAADVLNVSRCVEILGGGAAFDSKRPPLAQLAVACRALARRGIVNPLINIDIRLVPPSKFVVVEQAVSLEVLSEQTSLTEVLLASSRLLEQRLPADEHDEVLGAAYRLLPRTGQTMPGLQLTLPFD